MFNFPHNPTGALPSHRDFETIVELCEDAGARMFSDEMYRGLEYSTSSQLPSAFLASDNAVTLSGLSKAFALPGLRIGWLCTKDAELLARINE